MSKKKLDRNEKYNREILGIALISFGILSAISLFSYKTGIVGILLRNVYFTLMGFGGYIFPVIILALGLLFIINKVNIEDDKKSIYIFTLFICFLTLLNIKNQKFTTFAKSINQSLKLSKEGLGGGLIGGFLGYIFFKLFGTIGSYIIISFIIIVSILQFTEIRINDYIKKIRINKTWEKKQNNKINIKTDYKEEKFTNAANKEKKEIIIYDYTKNTPSNNNFKINKEGTDNITSNNKYNFTNFKLPPLDLLENPVKQDESNKKEILKNAKKIEETMNNFDIDAKIVQINKGPTITCFELQPAPGVKVSKIINLADDLALSLATSDIRIEAPIPGKSAVGIEVPNKIKDNVNLKEILKSEEYTNLDSDLPLTLGKDIAGKPIVSTIDKMPHLLIAGATGSGKSVCINTIILSILFKAHPDEVKLLLIDPKVVELSIYNGIPHLLIPVVTEPKKAAFALNWAVEEMERRYKIFAQNNVRDINSYNSKTKNKQKEKLFKIVIIIDELADLMMVAAQEVEDYICRLAQMARAAGIYLIVATQRPSVDVITGTIKANIPSRISFAVSSQIDSRTILDMAGAEKLLGKGDMLFFPSDSSKPIRIQGAYISDKEVEKVVKFLKKQNITEYDSNILKNIQKEVEINKFIDDSDALLPEAIKLVVDEGQASISLLQRKLKIGYARAARIIDEMEARGIIGGHEGSKPRKVLATKDDIKTLLGSDKEWE
ncbi:S-DNA-T family DNA segregation ATPase FtsK/SpoIIIE [Keratinibaculum paraultunense]|uniref:S-DNA-T family DNA segregation ATPase FtsK/SpoIIIE n=1 Tax=Keratinibaculum paraultunense TaxID=1278232 RepID=A0A4R3KWM5_9FIRM|nr:DNA translocase FtsK [Keratinibaculum paraultunense]QQY80684.1 DNA translocase FtsK [Keratinibaculum paraultunense]TCS89713.1 S-DNA-T family DNA segregation ATPase FtsK/SpoIIIE [Keratinibaculum paraultunense]